MLEKRVGILADDIRQRIPVAIAQMEAGSFLRMAMIIEHPGDPAAAAFDFERGAALFGAREQKLTQQGMKLQHELRFCLYLRHQETAAAEFP